MNVLYIINGLGFSRGASIGGSDKRAIEVARNINKSKEAQVSILTTESGRNIFEHHEHLKTTYYEVRQPFWWPKFLEVSLFGRALSYFYATVVSLLWTGKFKDFDIFYATTDFFFDIVPAWFFARFYRKKAAVIIHHYIVGPNSRSGSKLTNILLYLSQRFSFVMIDFLYNTVFFYDSPEGREISRLFKHIKHKYYVKNGIDEKTIDSADEGTKIYAACFVGGIRHSKGVGEFVPIWKKVIKDFPKAKLLVIGGGSRRIIDHLVKEIEEAKLSKSILLVGSLSGRELFEKIKQSRVFLLPSHEEGWGIALCEAMYCSLPCVVYDLPAFEIFGQDLKKVEKGDWGGLADRVLYFLKNPKLAQESGRRMKKVASRFTWSKIAKEELHNLAVILK